jgi:hypothetical protein
MIMVVKYWLIILRMENGELVRVCYEWQTDNLEFDSWTKKLKLK